MSTTRPARHATARIHIPVEDAVRSLTTPRIFKFDRGSRTIGLSHPMAFCDVALQCETVNDLDAFIAALTRIADGWRADEIGTTTNEHALPDDWQLLPDSTLLELMSSTNLSRSDCNAVIEELSTRDDARADALDLAEQAIIDAWNNR